MVTMQEKPSQLSPEEHESIRQQICSRELSGTTPQDKPKAVILAGQPGAGKSALKEQARWEFGRCGGAVEVDTDELRDDHPDYADFCKENDRTAANRVQADAGQWADELIFDASSDRRNLIIDGTLKNPGNAKRLASELRARDYEVEVRALAVAKEDSLLGIHTRYWRKKEKDETGRWTPELVHNEACDGMLRSCEALEQEGLVDRISVYRRGGNEAQDTPTPDKIYDNPKVATGGANGAATAIAAERDRSRSHEELRARAELYDEVSALARKHDPHMRTPENHRLHELRAQSLVAAGHSPGPTTEAQRRLAERRTQKEPRRHSEDGPSK